MKRGYDPAGELHREASRDAKKSIVSRTGPPQVDVIKKFSGAARLYKEQGAMDDARQVLTEAERYLGGRGKSSGNSTLRKRIADQLSELNEEPLRKRKFERGFAYAAILSFVVALFFISFNLTGNIVLEESRTNLGFLALGLFVMGLTFTFFYFKNKK